MWNKLTKADLFSTLSAWNEYCKKKIHLIACGGTAMTLLGIKESTKDVDFMIPVEKEHKYFTKILSDLGYHNTVPFRWKKSDEAYEYDLFIGKTVYCTELLESPLEDGNHMLTKEFSRLYVGVLNHYDLIISKLFRGEGVDFEDCLNLVRAKHGEIKFDVLENRYRKTAGYDISEVKVNKNYDQFVEILKKERLYVK